jgi:NADPH-dependent 2,4-dienoyl-CoA reductase/sulfur reductase-like enzyme
MRRKETFVKGYKYMILGGGVVAGYAARQFVERGVKAGELGIISADTQLPYERPPLSKEYLAGKTELEGVLINDAEFYRKHFIGVRLDDPVVSVDLVEKRLETRSNNVFACEKLLIATGSRVRTLEVPNADLNGIHTLRWLDDARSIRVDAEVAEKAVVIGGGFIGMEVASQLAQRGIDTTMVFPEERLMAKVFTPKMSAFFRHYFQERGVSIVTQAEIDSFAGNQAVSAVILRSGKELAADLVVAGIGVEPEVELFNDSGLKLDDGVVVNEYLETDITDVYAAGDVARYYDVVFEKQRRVEHWDNAVQHGKHAANIMTGDRKPLRHVPYFFSDVFDLSWEFWGDPEGADSAIHRGAVDEGSFSTWWIQGERIVAAFVMKRPDEERELAPVWIETGELVSAAHLRDRTQTLRRLSVPA